MTRWCALALWGLAAGCGADHGATSASPELRSAAPTTADSTAAADGAPTATAASTEASSASTPIELADDANLQAGWVAFAGTAMPTKGGLQVRGVTLAIETLNDKLDPAKRTGYDQLLGARLHIVAELLAEGAGDRGPQARAGDDLFRARSVATVKLLAPAQIIEGELHRSKGFYSIASHLVGAGQLARMLSPGSEEKHPEFQRLLGRRVRLTGQPRVEVCDPGAQCLIGGSLPLFDVAKAELLP